MRLSTKLAAIEKLGSVRLIPKKTAITAAKTQAGIASFWPNRRSSVKAMHTTAAGNAANRNRSVKYPNMLIAARKKAANRAGTAMIDRRVRQTTRVAMAAAMRPYAMCDQNSTGGVGSIPGGV